MSQDLSPYDVDILFLRAEFAKWWKLPTLEQEEIFCERVAIMCQYDNVDENEIRKQIFEMMIFK